MMVSKRSRLCSPRVAKKCCAADRAFTRGAAAAIVAAANRAERTAGVALAACQDAIAAVGHHVAGGVRRTSSHHRMFDRSIRTKRGRRPRTTAIPTTKRRPEGRARGEGQGARAYEERNEALIWSEIVRALTTTSMLRSVSALALDPRPSPLVTAPRRPSRLGPPGDAPSALLPA